MAIGLADSTQGKEILTLGNPGWRYGEPSVFNLEAAIAENATGKAKQW
jgi:hypothetical protein